MGLIQFERRITVEEAEETRIRVRKDLVPRLAALGRELAVRLRGRWFEATVELDLCQCAGVQRPHTHAFLVLRGDPGLAAADRLMVEVAARPA